MSEEKHDCPLSLNAFVERFDSLQCSVGACGGAIDNPNALERACKGCEKYLPNAMKRDQESIDRPIEDPSSMSLVGLANLKLALLDGVGSLVNKEAEKLKQAVENNRETNVTCFDGIRLREKSEGDLLVAASLLEFLGRIEDDQGAGSFYYKPTEEGHKMYDLIFG